MEFHKEREEDVNDKTAREHRNHQLHEGVGVHERADRAVQVARDERTRVQAGVQSEENQQE